MSSSDPLLHDPSSVPTVLTADGDSIPVADTSSADVVPGDEQLLPADRAPLDRPDARGLTAAELEERDAYDAEMRARRLPTGGQIPQTFTDESTGIDSETQVVEGKEDAGRRAALDALKMDDLRALLPEDAAPPASPSKAALVDALVAAGVNPPPETAGS